MSDLSPKEIKKHLLEMNYLTTLHKTPKGAILTLPRGGFDYEGMDHESNYKLEYKGKKSILYWNDEEYIIGPEYSLRLLVITDIYNECRKINYDPQYIAFYDLDEQELPDDAMIQDMFPAPRSKRQQQLELDYLSLYYEAQKDKFDEVYNEIAENLGIREGYDLIRGLYGD